MSDEQLDSGGVVGNSGGVPRLDAAGPSDRLAKDGITTERLVVVSADGAGMPAAANEGDSAASTAAPAVDELSGAGVCGDGRGGRWLDGKSRSSARGALWRLLVLLVVDSLDKVCDCWGS